MQKNTKIEDPYQIFSQPNVPLQKNLKMTVHLWSIPFQKMNFNWIFIIFLAQNCYQQSGNHLHLATAFQQQQLLRLWTLMHRGCMAGSSTMKKDCRTLKYLFCPQIFNWLITISTNNVKYKKNWSFEIKGQTKQKRKMLNESFFFYFLEAGINKRGSSVSTINFTVLPWEQNYLSLCWNVFLSRSFSDRIDFLRFFPE